MKPTSEQPEKNGKDGARGFILVASYMFVSVLSILSIALFARNASYITQTTQTQNKMTAFNLAEAGVDQAIRQLMIVDDSYGDQLSRYPCAAGAEYSTTSGCTTGFVSMDNGAGTIRGGYEIWVDDPSPTSNYRHIRVAGHAPGDGSATVDGDCTGSTLAQRGFNCRAIEVYVQIDDTLMEYAAFGESIINLNGSSTYTDSYNSDTGAYGGSNVGSAGDIGGNGSIGDEITLNGTPNINGSILEQLGIECAADAASAPISSMGTLTVNGTESLPTVAGNVYHYDDIRVQSANGDLVIGPSDPADPNYGQPVTIYVDGNVTINAGQITVNSPTTIYVGGAVSAGGNGIVNSNADPEYLTIISYQGGDVDISGGTNFYGAIFAPDSQITSSGGVNIFGAMFGADFDHNGSGQIHYDEALSDMKLPCAIVRVKAWTEKQTYFG